MRRLSKAVKCYDPDLFLSQNPNGQWVLMRKRFQWKTYWVDGMSLVVPHMIPDSVFPLTHDYSFKGRSVEWGIEPILERLRKIDSHRSQEMFEKLNASYERDHEEKQKQKTQMFEDIAREWRPAAKKIADDTMIHSLSNYDRRRKAER